MAGYVIPGYLPGIFGASRRFSFLFLHIETFYVIFSAKIIILFAFINKKITIILSGHTTWCSHPLP